MCKTYKFIMPVPRGLSMGSIAKLMESAGTVLEKKTGMKIEVVEYKYDYDEDPIKAVLDRVKKKEIAIAMVFPTDYAMYKMKNKINTAPLFTITMFGKPYHNLCFYTRKSDNITKASQLRGKVWGGVRTRNARFLLTENGIKDKMSKFFSDIKFIREENIAVMFDALLRKKIDVFTLPSYQVNMSINTSKKYKEIVGVKCQEYEHNWMFVYNKDMMSADNAVKIKKAFLRAHKDKDFAQFKFLLAAVKGRFVEVDPKYLQNTKKLATLWLKTDWLKEELAFIKKSINK